MLDADFKSSLVDGLVKTRKCLSGMCRRKLSNTKESGKENDIPNYIYGLSYNHFTHFSDNIFLSNCKILLFSEPKLGA